MMSVCAHIVSLNGDNRAMTNEQRLLLSPAERDAKILGSKFFLCGHITYVSTMWTLKLCMLLFFQRLTRGLAAEKLIKPAIAVVATTWLVEFLTLLLTCRPVSHNWQIYPDPGSASSGPPQQAQRADLNRALHARKPCVVHRPGRLQCHH